MSRWQTRVSRALISRVALLHRHPVQIGAGRRRRRRRIRHLVGRRRGDVHAIEADAEFLRRHLRHFLKQALAHFRAAVIEVNRPS